MVASHRSIIVAAALLAASTAGASADYYGGVKDVPVVMTQPASWYVRGDLGYAWTDASELNGAITGFSTLSIDNTWSAGLGVGTYFGRGFRGDITYEWRGSTSVGGSGVCGANTITSDFDLRTSLLLANAYYDFRPYERLTPYVGIGVGAANHHTSSGTYVRTGGCGPATQSFSGDSDWSAAGALMAGFSFRLDRGERGPVSIKDGPAYVEPGRLHLDVGYRFLYLGDAHTGTLAGVTPSTPGPRLDDITAHEIRVGLRWDIR